MGREPNSLLKLAGYDLFEEYNEKAIIWIDSLKDGS